MSKRHELRHAGLLVAANLLTMALPLAVLPLLAQRIGLHAFGLVALAQTVGFIPVLLVDAGFNTESMRATAGYCGTPPLQPLLDNLIARVSLALPAALATLAAGALISGLPVAYVAASLLQLLGTLLFPQWWLIAIGASTRLIALQITGRLCSLIGIFFMVRSPDDALLATALQCGATACSGVLFAVWLLLLRGRDFRALDWFGHRAYFTRVAPAVGSGFFSSLSSYAPSLLLGATSGPQQVGLYAPGEKIVRAVAFAVGAVDQSFVAPVARRMADSTDSSRRAALAVIAGIFAVTACIGITLAVSAKPLMHLLFGPAFAASAPVLSMLSLWLPFYVARRAWVNLRLAAQARIALVSRSQYAEAIATTALCAVGAWSAGAFGAACGLVAAEAVACCVLGVISRKGSSST
jgi:polysaccharide transporter, PST family